MAVSRRNTIIGLGALVVGGGAVLGTGAFTQVEAQRTVTVETAGDAAALLSLTPADGDEDSGFAQIDDDGLLFIAFDTDNGDGLNLQARTRFDELVDVANNGTQDVDQLIIDLEESDDPSDAESQLIDDDRISVIVDGENEDLGQNVLEDPLTSGGDPVTFGLEIDLIGADEFDDETEFDLTLVIEANAADE